MAKIETKRYATFVDGKWRGDSYRTAFEAKRAASGIPGAVAKFKDGFDIPPEEPKKKPEPKAEPSEESSAPFAKSVRKL